MIAWQMPKMKSDFVSMSSLVVPTLQAFVPYPSLGLKSYTQRKNDFNEWYWNILNTHIRGFSLCTTRSWPRWCLLAWVLPWGSGDPRFELDFQFGYFAYFDAKCQETWYLVIGPFRLQARLTLLYSPTRLCTITVSCDSFRSAQAPAASG